jgi:LysM repeat protein
MQRIERYGVIALVLLLVTIAAVSLWDDGTAAEEVATRPAEERAQAQRPVRPAPAMAERAAAPRAAGRGAAGSARRDTAASDGLPVVAPGTARPGVVSPARAPRSAAPQAAGPGARGAATPPQPGPAFRELPARVVEAPRPAAPEPEPLVVPPYEEPADRRGLAARRDPVAPEPVAPREEPPRRAPEREEPVAPPVAGRTYTVRPGDSLSRIASRELGSQQRMGEILSLNGLTDPDRIFVGQELRLPGAGASVVVPAAAERPAPREASAPASGDGVYVVRAGEVLGAIAQRELGRASRYGEIVALNPGLDPDRITEGQRLVMPADWAGGGAVASALPRTPARRVPAASTRGKVR